MQPANGIHLIRVEIYPGSPEAGEEVCVLISSPLPGGSLTVRVTIGSNLVHNGPPPPNNEICFNTSPDDQGKALVVSVSGSPSSGLTAYGGAVAILQ